MRLLVTLTAAAALTLFQAGAQAGGDADAGKKKADEVCAQCHGPVGNGPSPAFPKLAGQYADYLARALLDYQTGARQNPIMAGFSASLSKQDIEDLAAFYASQKSDLFTVKYAE